jgi:hypothetical protein
LPPSSANCLLAAGFLSLAIDAIRVPRPAAGIMTVTFMRANSIYESKAGRSGQWHATGLEDQATKLSHSHEHRSCGGSVRQNHAWLSLLSYCLFLTLGAALLVAVIIAAGSIALASHQNAFAQGAAAMPPANPAPQAGTRFTGMITDSHCGARHMRHSNMLPEQCARACYRKGASYILIDGDRRYTLIGGDGALDKFVGARATVTGTLQGDAIIVDSAAPVL